MQELVAIIDIGYNAIRAVVYENNDLGAPEIFSNKFKSDLLSLLSNEKLDIKHPSYLTIEYLLHVFKRLGVAKINCVATAVLREHPRAEEFLKYIKKQYNLNIRIITGQEEARLSAIGLIHGVANCHGIAADLGGGSLELVEIDDANISHLTSLKLGTRMISERKLADISSIADIIKHEYGERTYENIYFIGGAMRFLGRLYLDFINYPIKNLHNLEIDIKTFASYLSKLLISLNNPKNKINRKKININAILVAQAMINVFQPKKVLISTYGLKEGVRFEALKLPYHNVLEEKVAYACNYDISATNFDNYAKILYDITGELTDLYKLLKLSIMFNSLKKRFDKTLPPKALIEYILSAEIPIEPKLRLMLALIAGINSDFKLSNDMVNLAKQIITREDYVHSQIIGHFLAIAEAVDGPNFMQPSFSIKLTNGYYELDHTQLLPRPIFDKIRGRLKNIAQAQKNLKLTYKYN
ncbi:MAG: Ppx/GppA family phosphatase [Rickettsiaceae bacterium]|nr:Ppx/GppA family phosphatase [Rickettsiaceae bacterium]